MQHAKTHINAQLAQELIKQSILMENALTQSFVLVDCTLKNHLKTVNHVKMDVETVSL